MAEIDGLLKARGLTDHERKVYTTLLESGPSHAGFISSRTGIHRRNVYDCLARMSKKGLIGYIKENNRKLYSITNPKNMLDVLESERSGWESLMPELLTKYSQGTEKKETLFFRGKAGIKQVLEHQLSTREEILVLATTAQVTGILKHYMPKFQLLRAQAKIKTRMLFDKEKDDAITRAYFKDIKLCKVKYKEGLNDSLLAQYIYGDNVALIVWSENPIAIVIKEKEAAKGMRCMFELLWNS